MRRGIVVAGMLLALGLAGTAEGLDSYQSDVQLGLAKTELTAGNDLSLKALGYRLYFAPVDTMEGPYELQPFTQRASWAQFEYVWGEDEGAPVNDYKAFGIFARYVVPNSVVGIDLSYSSMDRNDADWVNDLRLGAVVWLNDASNLALEAGIALGEVTAVASDTTTLDVGARCIMPIQDFKLEIAGRYKSVDYEDTGTADESGIEVQTRFFFTKEVFAGFSFSTVDDDTTDTSNWMLSGGYSHSSGLHAEIDIGEINDGDALMLTVGFRF